MIPMPLFRLHPSRIVAICALGLLTAGCVAVPGDPYYGSGGAGYYPGPSSMTVYEQPGMIYTAPPLGWRNYPAPPPGWREDAWRERQWRQSREHEAYERRDADRRRDMDQRAREQPPRQYPDPNAMRGRRDMDAERNNPSPFARPGMPRPDWR